VPLNAIIHASLLRQGSMAKAPEETYAWIRAHTPADAILMSYGDASIFLHTGRLCRTMPRWQSPQELLAFINANPVDYVLANDTAMSLKSPSGHAPRDPLSREELGALIMRTGAFSLVFDNTVEGFAVYQHIKPVSGKIP
jgi:hypothetical protein